LCKKIEKRGRKIKITGWVSRGGRIVRNRGFVLIVVKVQAGGEGTMWRRGHMWYQGLRNLEIPVNFS